MDRLNSEPERVIGQAFSSLREIAEAEKWINVLWGIFLGALVPVIVLAIWPVSGGLMFSEFQSYMLVMAVLGGISAGLALHYWTKARRREVSTHYEIEDRIRACVEPDLFATRLLANVLVSLTPITGDIFLERKLFAKDRDNWESAEDIKAEDWVELLQDSEDRRVVNERLGPILKSRAEVLWDTCIKGNIGRPGALTFDLYPSGRLKLERQRLDGSKSALTRDPDFVDQDFVVLSHSNEEIVGVLAASGLLDDHFSSLVLKISDSVLQKLRQIRDTDGDILDQKGLQGCLPREKCHLFRLDKYASGLRQISYKNAAGDQCDLTRDYPDREQLLALIRNPHDISQIAILRTNLGSSKNSDRPLQNAIDWLSGLHLVESLEGHETVLAVDATRATHLPAKLPSGEPIVHVDTSGFASR